MKPSQKLFWLLQLFSDFAKFAFIRETAFLKKSFSKEVGFFNDIFLTNQNDLSDIATNKTSDSNNNTKTNNGKTDIAETNTNYI